jgi:hypothetical protein
MPAPRTAKADSREADMPNALLTRSIRAGCAIGVVRRHLTLTRSRPALVVRDASGLSGRRDC